MNANVHLLGDVRLETLARFCDNFEVAIAEAAQLALKNGLTTVYDTWGPRSVLQKVSASINSGTLVGSRIFHCGNIIGFDGPLSPDFMVKAAEIASPLLTRRINATWVENVGRHLMWLTPDEVAHEVAKYIRHGIDFVKFASNEHMGTSTGAFLAFSQDVQSAIVREAHKAGLTAQAHTMSVEGLRIAIEAGSDLIQHANHTGPAVIPEKTLELMVTKKTSAVVFPLTEKRLSWLAKNESYRSPIMWQMADRNVRNLIVAGVPILLGNDGSVLTKDSLADPRFERNFGGPWEGSLFSLSDGHFAWLEAMEEKGLPALQILRAASINIATALGQDQHLGSIGAGKFADVLVLDNNPLESAKHYRSIHMVIKEGKIIDRNSLPTTPLLTREQEAPTAEERAYVPFLPAGGPFPLCPLCFNLHA
jgi:imidazolonepropionase-like amidohydrolase